MSGKLLHHGPALKRAERAKLLEALDAAMQDQAAGKGPELNVYGGQVLRLEDVAKGLSGRCRARGYDPSAGQIGEAIPF